MQEWHPFNPILLEVFNKSSQEVVEDLKVVRNECVVESLIHAFTFTALILILVHKVRD